MVWLLDLQLPVQSMPITTKVVSSNPVVGEVYSIQHYVIKFVSDLWHVDGFLWVLGFPPPTKLTVTILLKYCWKLALNTITLTPNHNPPFIYQLLCSVIYTINFSSVKLFFIFKGIYLILKITSSLWSSEQVYLYLHAKKH
jgi:hypothetical protein